MTVWAFKGIPMSYGPILDATGYIFISVFGFIFFKEKLNIRKTAGLIVIISGIVIASL